MLHFIPNFYDLELWVTAAPLILARTENLWDP